VPLLLVAGHQSFYKQLFNKMKGQEVATDASKLYTGNESADVTEELIKNRIRIDPDGLGENKAKPWLKDGKMRVIEGQKAFGLPHPAGTHVLVSDDVRMLSSKLQQLIPTGYIIINGGYEEASKFCSAVHAMKPVFVFKHTGGASDLICETLKKADDYMNKKKLNPKAKPSKPFKLDLPPNYHHDRYIWPFSDDDIMACKELNILMDNFPSTYNPLSVLAIDMFTMTEEKLQDQLTKTMSVAFEGVTEMGGQALENKRLTVRESNEDILLLLMIHDD
jgi:hypothetical protein